MFWFLDRKGRNTVKRYEKGDYVQYGVNGVCLIEDVRRDSLTKKSAGEYYVLKPVGERSATILVPTDSETLVGRMAPLPGREELDELILSTRGRELEWIDDRKERAAQFQQAVKRCDLRELLCLVGCIYRRRLDLTAAGKKLPAADETVLRRAEGLIENELGFVLDLEGPQVGAYIREKLGIEEEE